MTGSRETPAKETIELHLLQRLSLVKGQATVGRQAICRSSEEETREKLTESEDSSAYFYSSSNFNRGGDTRERDDRTSPLVAPPVQDQAMMGR